MSVVSKQAWEKILSREVFADRHIGPVQTEEQHMLTQLGCTELDELIQQVVPESIRLSGDLDIPASVSEQQALTLLRTMAEQNQLFKSFIGQGYYNCYCPAVIQRNVLENPAWYTAYTPYQAEISQGRLEALFNFQTMVSDLTGLEIANASMLDEATAAAEAMTLCLRMTKAQSHRFFVDEDCFPQTIEIIKTRAEPIGVEVIVGNPLTDLFQQEVFGVLLQYPGASGQVNNYQALIRECQSNNTLVVMAADLLALLMLKSPGAIGADIAIGTTQRFGVPPGFGGPHAAYFATRDNFKRSIPGRIVGLSKDKQGKPAYRLALQTREQHIRREKATSNICTAQVLLAVIASMYAVYHGAKGLLAIANRVYTLTTLLAEGLRQGGLVIKNTAWFDTLTVEVKDAEAVHALSREHNINLRYIDIHSVGISLDETTTTEDIEALWIVLLDGYKPGINSIADNMGDNLEADVLRTDSLLTHSVFTRYQSETEMLRYLRTLADRDIALDRAMIPLGSCTMKLNATTEMLPVTWPEFASMHPYVPLEQARGYQQLIAELEDMLCAITGYSAFSLQPNAGSQGEYAGLLAIRAYHKSRGEEHRNICLIPKSAHGTNPASAHMCGMKVVAVNCDVAGNVDVKDLAEKAQLHSENLSAIMVTYPSTHGVFEEAIQQVCEIVHEHGGQVYMDGANLNAMVGLCQPGKFGGDVSHLNLHKTFCIPHGGGGPGVGPIGVAAHLAPFLPTESFTGSVNAKSGAMVAAAPWGSAGILAISWMYIRMMGAQGLTQASKIAILNANYIAERLQQDFPVLYRGARKRVAHECIIDLRPYQDECGISVEDVAKRLIDYGFHAPTMSFPVPGTLMIEPTESESLVELDRFCDAMLSIKQEIEDIRTGHTSPVDNPLVNAPHTAEALVTEHWNKPYSREQAVFPGALKQNKVADNKYWPPVGRVDNVAGDKHLVCTHPAEAD